MKKRILCLLMSLIMLCSCAMAISSCGEQKDTTTAITTSREEAYYSWGSPYIVVYDRLPFKFEETKFARRATNGKANEANLILVNGKWEDHGIKMGTDFYIVLYEQVIYRYGREEDGTSTICDSWKGRHLKLNKEETAEFESLLGMDLIERTEDGGIVYDENGDVIYK